LAQWACPGSRRQVAKCSRSDSHFGLVGESIWSTSSA
jgi:hypothetical protein